MSAAPLPPDEAERLALLHALALLDSPPEPALDRITRLAARLLNVPIALVSLIDRDRQWFKSRVGLDATETPRDQAFCAHAILQTAPLVVGDATQDPRFLDNPLVTDAPGIRFYAGVPIRTSGGVALGTLCAIDDKPRRPGPDDIQALQDLADLVSKEVQLRETLALARDQLDRSQAVLLASEARYRSMFELAAVGIALVAPDGGWISANGALCQMLGRSADAVRQATLRALTHPDDVAQEEPLLEALQRREADHYQLEKRYLRPDGKAVWVNQNVTQKFNAAGQLEYYVVIVKDIGARKCAEAALAAAMQDLEARVAQRTQELQQANAQLQAAVEQQTLSARDLRRREAELAAVLEHANDAYVGMDEDGRVTAWNLQASAIFGWSAAQAIGQPLSQLIVPPALREAHLAGLQRYLRTGRSKMMDQRLELPAVRQDGSELTLELRIRALEVDGQHLFSAFMHDISERKREEERRLREARIDPLTGLFNRRALEEMLPQALARADREDKPLALLFIDLDGFKAVNDTLGHDAGDAVLREVATRLRAQVRQSDSVVRLAGDEFTVVLEQLNGGLAAARQVAQKLLAQLERPVLVSGALAQVGASVGVAMYLPGSGESPQGLVKTADAWMYQAKRAGKGRILPDG
ncbi:diguanylate cyclase domain-containing protein [Aquabacterium sp. A08]|uniref:diguanylate cyclase domain-containing protein n=1 Tax=Aquabacterium sp. A08 TaxID=2718532 RepID=UPI0014227B26|nr:diguanylate cyclase [Aquabacterium sp. A08]